MSKYADHNIKVNRALSASRIGGVHGGGDHDIPQCGCAASALAMLDAIPETVVAQLSAAALADLLDAMWMMCERTKAIAAADVIQEGAVWDAKQQRLREIVA